MKRFSAIFVFLKQVFLFAVLIVLCLYLFGYVCSVIEYFHYRNLKVMNVNAFAKHHIPMKIPVSRCGSYHMEGPAVSVYTTDGYFGMHFDDSKKKVYFNGYRSFMIFYVIDFVYEVTDPNMEKLLFEKFRCLLPAKSDSQLERE